MLGILALLGFLLLAAPPSPAGALPRPAGFVNDFAGVLDETSRAELVRLAAEVERATSAEIAVAVVPSLDGRTVEEYAEALFNAWGVGKKGKDNGVLVLVCPSCREARLEVGYGLEPVIPDGLAGEVLREHMIPHFKTGDYAAGLLAGTGRIAGILTDGAVALSPKAARSLPEPKGRSPLARAGVLTGLGLFLSLFTGLGFAAVGLAFRRKVVFFLVWGALFGGIPLLLLAAGAVPFPYSAIPLGGAAAGFWAGRRWGHKVPVDGKRGKRGWIGFSGGSGGGRGGGWSGGSSSGGFGGGSSGGGGASGRW